jgi:hypothetical protein
MIHIYRLRNIYKVITSWIKKLPTTIKLYLEGKQIVGSVVGIRAEIRKLTGDVVYPCFPEKMC